MKNKKDFLSIADLSAKETWDVLFLAKKLKEQYKKTGRNREVLKNKTLAMIFEKQSLRTRLSFEIGMTQLGGHAVYLAPEDIGMGKRESVEDVSRVISSMADIIMARTFLHETVQSLAKYSTVPVVNGLTRLEHPCQALADIMTIWEEKSGLAGLTVAYIGDGENNVAHSLCLMATMLSMYFRCASPKKYFMNSDIVKKAEEFGEVVQTEDPQEAVANADVVVADTWISMGDRNKEKRKEIFKNYQVNSKLMSYAKKGAIFMHCLPAYRGNEVTAEVIDGPQSVVFQEAENRLHVQKALLLYLLS